MSRRDVVLDLFDLQVLDAYTTVGKRPLRPGNGETATRAVAQAVVVELNLAMTARNIARVVLSIDRLIKLGREVIQKRRDGVAAGEIVLVAADAQGRPRQVLRRIRA